MFAPLWAPESAPRPPVSTDTSSTAPNRTGTVAKNTVPPLLKPFEASLIPSTVTLTAPPGRLLYLVLPGFPPLADETPPDVGGDAPGASLARASTLLRLPRGNSLTAFEVRVLATNWDEVSRVCVAPPVTRMDSEAAPISRCTTTSVVWLV